MPIDALDVDVSTGALALEQRLLAGQPHSARRHPRHPGCRSRAGRADACRRRRRDDDIRDPQLLAGDLLDDVRDALTNLRGRAEHLRREPAVSGGEQSDTGGGRVVKALRVADVLHADGEAAAASYT